MCGYKSSPPPGDTQVLHKLQNHFVPQELILLMDDLRFYILFNSISVKSGQREADTVYTCLVCNSSIVAACPSIPAARLAFRLFYSFCYSCS